MACDEITEETHPDMILTLRDFDSIYNLRVPNAAYMVSSPQADVCHLGVSHKKVNTRSGPAMVLGETFMRYYHTVFDRQDGSIDKARIGIGKAAHTKETHNAVKSIVDTHFDNTPDVDQKW